MKKLVSFGLLTVCALAISERQAQAWINSRFSIGLNWHHQSANTSTLWGLWRNGQIPGPEAFGPGPGGPPPGVPGGPGGPGGAFPFYGAQSAPQGGYPLQQGAFTQNMPQGYPQGFPQGYPQNYPQGYPQGYPQAYPQQYPQGYPVAMPQQLPANMRAETAAPPLLQTTSQPQPYSALNTGWNNLYQSVSYQPNGYSNYQPNYYYYPAYSYEVPYYWYGAR